MDNEQAKNLIHKYVARSLGFDYARDEKEQRLTAAGLYNWEIPDDYLPDEYPCYWFLLSEDDDDDKTVIYIYPSEIEKFVKEVNK